MHALKRGSSVIGDIDLKSNSLMKHVVSYIDLDFMT